MGRVDIRGIILPDCCIAVEGIEGTTLTDVRTQLAACDDGIDLHIDSIGGDVGTANAISVALQEWRYSHQDKPATVTLGAICASAAANIVAKLPQGFAAQAYADTLIMFHSCTGTVEGGPEALRDNAVLMDLVNSMVIGALMAKTTLDPQRIKAAFAEGRELWLTGSDAVACGLATGLVEGTAGDASPMLTALSHADNRFVACLAGKLAAGITNNREGTIMAEEIKEEIKEEIREQAPIVEPVKEEVKEEVIEEVKEEVKEEGGAELAALKAECDKLKAENEELLKKVEELTEVVQRYGVSATASAKPSKNFAELVRALPKNLSEDEYAKQFIALKAQHKAEYDAYMAAHTLR